MYRLLQVLSLARCSPPATLAKLNIVLYGGCQSLSFCAITYLVLQPGTPDSYAPLPEETDSAKVRLASAGAVGGMDSPLPQTPTTIASRAPEVVSLHHANVSKLCFLYWLILHECSVMVFYDFRNGSLVLNSSRYCG